MAANYISRGGGSFQKPRWGHSLGFQTHSSWNKFHLCLGIQGGGRLPQVWMVVQQEQTGMGKRNTFQRNYFVWEELRYMRERMHVSMSFHQVIVFFRSSCGCTLVALSIKSKEKSRVVPWVVVVHCTTVKLLHTTSHNTGFFVWICTVQTFHILKGILFSALFWHIEECFDHFP